MPKFYLKMFIFAPVTTIFVINNGTYCGQTVVCLSAMLMVDAGPFLVRALCSEPSNRIIEARREARL
jgi:hypothetical protein